MAVSLMVTGRLVGTLGFWGLLGFLTVVNVCAATQDIGVDGLVVDILEDHERRVRNSVQAAAYKVGMLGGGFGLTWLFPRVALRGCFWAMAGAVAVAVAVGGGSGRWRWPCSHRWRLESRSLRRCTRKGASMSSED
jgi:predicted MFS family arabinose efflux permease